MSRQKQKAILEPVDFILYSLGEKHRQTEEHRTILWCLDREVYKNILTNKNPENIITGLSGELYLATENLALAGKTGIGSPACVVFLEELIACGFSEFVIFGSAGALHKEIRIGDTILCTGAYSDEGTSTHYPNHSYLSKPDRKLLNRLSRWFQDNKIPVKKALSWTTDAPFKETNSKLEHFLNLGAEVVEMEASALFNVARYRKVEIASVFVVGDSIAEGNWERRFLDPEIKSLSLQTARDLYQFCCSP